MQSSVYGATLAQAGRVLLFSFAWYFTLFLWLSARHTDVNMMVTPVFCFVLAYLARAQKTASCAAFVIVALAIMCASFRVFLREQPPELSRASFVVGTIVRERGDSWMLGVHGNDVQVFSRAFASAGLGDRVRCDGEVRVHRAPQNPLGVVHWPIVRDERLTMNAPDCRVIAPASPLLRWIRYTRTRARYALQHSLSQRSLGLGVALVLGDTSDIDEDDMQIVRLSTTAHLIAVSGMHVVLVCGTWVSLLRRALLRTRFARYHDVRRWAWFLGAVSAPIYAIFSGGSMSAFRGAAMVGTLWLCAACARSIAPSRSLAFSILVCTAFTPHVALDLGFALSVAATAGLLCATRDAKQNKDYGFLETTKPNFAGRARESICIFLRASLYAQAATVPLTIWAFQVFSPLGLLANLTITPTLGVLLVPALNAHCLVASATSSWPTRLSAHAVDLLLATYLRTSAWFASSTLVPMGRVELFAVMALCFAIIIRHRRVAVLAACIIAISELCLRVPPFDPEICLLDVGQGDAALLRFPSGRNMWIDSGPPTRESRAAIIEALRAYRISHIDVLVLTHGHPDHFGGAQTLSEHATVGEVWWNGGEPKDPLSDTLPAYASLLGTLRKNGTRLIDAATRCNTASHEGDVEVRVLHPCGYDFAETENDNSIALTLRRGSYVAFFAGDIEMRSERLLLQHLPENVDLLKVAHHGSRTSSTPGFVARSHPTLAFVSAGFGNSFGHPHSSVAERLRRVGRLHISANEGGLRVPMLRESADPRSIFSRSCASNLMLQTAPR